MKWIFYKSIIPLIMMVFCATAFSKNIIYGLKTAEDFKSSSKGDFYIQAESFLSKSRADQYKNRISSETDYPVQITRRTKFNEIMIGPIASAAEVRKTAQAILESNQSSPHHKSHIQAKTSRVNPQSPAKPITLATNQISATPGGEIPVSTPEAEAPDDEFFTSASTATSSKMAVTEKNSSDISSDITPDNEFMTSESSPDDEFSSSMDTTSTSSTATDTKNPAAYQSSFIATVGGGQQSQHFNSSTTVNNNSGFPAPYDQDIYTTEEDHQPVFAAFFGLHGQRDKLWLPGYSSGLFYQHLFTSNIGGTITQYSDPAFSNYNYDWDVSSDLLLGLLKINVFKVSTVSPYVLGGLGIAFNRSSDYQETPFLGVDPRVTPNFASHTTGQLAYSAGGGIDFQFWPQLIFSAEYQYQNLGHISTGSGTYAWSGQSLSLDSYHVNTFLVNASFLFGK
jgi:opacity protein-like surface antigen